MLLAQGVLFRISNTVHSGHADIAFDPVGLDIGEGLELGPVGQDYSALEKFIVLRGSAESELEFARLLSVCD